MTDLEDLVPGLKREVAVPGAFSRVFRETADSELVGSLMDAFANAKLDGFFPGHELDVDAETITPNLSTAGQALVRLYAAERIMVAQLANLKSRTLYEAGPVKYETEQAASVLAGILKLIADRKRHVMESAYATGMEVRDMFTERVIGVEL